MYFWTTFLVGFLAVAVITVAQDDDVSDTLLSALDAVSRRQRDLANAEGAYYGLGPYRESSEDGAFTSPEREASDGQPENIGYGFQKSMSDNSPPGAFSAPPLISMSQPNEELIQKLAIEYLENEFQNDNDANQYYRPGYDAKRSAFRERDLPERYANVLGKMEAKKRNSGAGRPPSSFRERSHGGDRQNEDKRRRFMASINRRIGQEHEDPISENEDQYPQMLQTLWERYRESNPSVVDIEDLSERDVEEIMNILGDEGDNGNEIADSELEKRYGGGGGGGGGYGYGGGYDFFNHGAAMNGGMGFKKRNKQRLDDSDASANAFLYSLKFVAPEHNREAVEQMRENEGMEFAGENDDDVVRAGLKEAVEEAEAREEPVWFPAVPENKDPEYFLKGDTAQPSQGQEDRARKRFQASAMSHHAGHGMDKKYLYDRALLKRKRFPVAKRSSNYYTLPTAQHHYGEQEARAKKDVRERPATDPKVASELSQIFASSSTNDNTVKIAPQIIGNHVVTKQKVVTTSTTPAPRAPSNSTNIEVTVVVNQYPKKNATVIEDKPNDEEMELPVTMSRLEIPIEVKKKSIDWSDYFGLDRRRKKTGFSQASAKTSNSALNDAWLVNQYYNALALSPDANARTVFRGNKNDAATMHKKDARFTSQPFDTRIYDANNLHKGMRGGASKKNQAAEMEEAARVENMDSKLRNIEDLIVNEALKYTGAHEGTTDSKEIQEVKDKVMSRLAAAYNLEKMRKALGEFKSSMAAQKMSKYNPENLASQDNSEDKKKRIAVKKEKAELKDMRAAKAKKVAHEEEGFAEFLEAPVAEALTASYGGDQGDQLNAEDCPILTKIVTKCRNAETGTGDPELHFLSMCTLHQICYICGPEVGSDSPSTCDGMFLSQADVVCNGDIHCEKSALRAMMAVKHHRHSDTLAVPTQCWENFCAAQYAMSPAVAD